MEPIDQLVTKLKVGNIVQLTSQAGNTFTGYFWVKEMSKPDRVRNEQPKFGKEDGKDQYQFAMSNPSGKDPSGQDYSLETRLPEFYVSEEKRVYKINGHVIDQGRILKPNDFETVKRKNLDRSDIGKILRLKLPGVDNYVVGHIVAEGAAGVIVSATNVWVPLSLVVQEDSSQRDSSLLTIPYQQRFFTSLRDLNGRLFDTNVNHIALEQIERYRS